MMSIHGGFEEASLRWKLEGNGMLSHLFLMKAFSAMNRYTMEEYVSMDSLVQLKQSWYNLRHGSLA
jgi:hypothetical protein